MNCLQNNCIINFAALLTKRYTITVSSSEYGIYSTKILDGPICSIRRKNHQVRSIQNLGDDPRVKFLFSPGIEIEPPNQYVECVQPSVYCIQYYAYKKSAWVKCISQEENILYIQPFEKLLKNEYLEVRVTTS